MSKDLLFEVQMGDPLEHYSRAIWDTQSMLRGDLYPAEGAPLRATQHAAIGFSNIFSTAETTLGESIQMLDGLDNIGAQLTNNHFYGEVPWETTATMDVGTDLSVGNDAIIGRDIATGRDVGVGRNLIVVGDGAIGDDLTVSGDLSVALTSTLTGKTGHGGVPDGTVQVKNYGALWNVGDVGIKVTPSGDFGLEIADDIGPSTDNARDLGSATKQWRNIYTEGLTADSPTLVVDAANHRVGFGIAAPTVANDFLGVVQMDLHTAIPTFYLDPVNHWIGVNLAAPATSLNVSGVLAVDSLAFAAPSSGVDRVELFKNTTTGIGHLISINRPSTYGPMYIDGSSVRLRPSGVVAFEVNATGIGFFGATPAAKPTVSGSRGGNAALADLLTELATLGLITNSSTA